MGVSFRVLSTWWMASLLSAVTLAAAGNDLRLVEAAQKGDRETVQSLVKQHADVNAAQPDGATALAWASQRDDLEMADLLIRAGAKVNAANDYGVTPLSLACTNGSSAMVEQLLKSGANPNAAQWDGETVLMTCVRPGNADAVKALLAHGANVNAQTRRGQTALMWAAAEKHPEVAKLLIEHGADVNTKSHTVSGIAPAMHITYGLHDHVTGKFDRVEPGEVHEDPSIPKGGFTALMFAAQRGDLDSARALLAAGAKLNDIAPEYGNALVVASANSQEEMALFLLDKGADPNVADGFGYTSLHYALWKGIAAISMNRHGLATDYRWMWPNLPGLVKALLAYGANPNARVTKGFPNFDYPAFARSVGHSLPQFNQIGITPFLLAAASGDASLMRLLVANGADPLMATEDGTTPLMAAAGIGRIDDRTEEEEKGALEAVQLAVELGANVNAANRQGRTALQGAAFMGSNAIIQFLVDKGANIDGKDKYGQSALSIAEGDPTRLADSTDKRFQEHGGPHKSTSDLLLKLGATPPPARVAETSASGAADRAR